MSRPNRVINPREGRCARYISFSSDDFPAPLAPVMKWKEPGVRVKLMSRSTSNSMP